jgi:hypothetical protein
MSPAATTIERQPASTDGDEGFDDGVAEVPLLLGGTDGLGVLDEPGLQAAAAHTTARASAAPPRFIWFPSPSGRPPIKRA